MTQFVMLVSSLKQIRLDSTLGEAFKLTLACLISILLIHAPAHAEPTVGPFTISNLRPYIDSNDVYITVNVAPPQCPTTVFKLNMTRPLAREAYALLVTALTSGRSISLEIRNSTGCVGWATEIQSVFMF